MKSRDATKKKSRKRNPSFATARWISIGILALALLRASVELAEAIVSLISQ